jgi:exosortase
MNQEPRAAGRSARFRLYVVLPVLGAGLLWISWPALRDMVGHWSHDPRYSHGYFVPVFSLFLLWLRRDRLAAGAAQPSGWGIPLIAAGEALRLVGARYSSNWLGAIPLLPSLAGLSLLLGGWRALRWSAPSIAFLAFMIPLPYRVEMGLGYPLQRIATLASSYALQTFGLPAVAEGNIILLNEARIGVVEACNGLGMLFMFFAFAVAVALVVRRPLVDKGLIVLSAIPIALAANIARITVTGLLHETAGGVVADAVYHDLAGWLMMPLALGTLWAELALLSRLFLEPDPQSAPPAGLIPIGDIDPARGRGWPQGRGSAQPALRERAGVPTTRVGREG